jgi:Protein of unknown function (DUF2934)
MAKSTSGGTKKPANGEAAAKAASGRRQTSKKPDIMASAPDMAGNRTPSSEEIARLAYELYVQRGGVNGYHLEDWYEAERQLKGRT